MYTVEQVREASLAYFGGDELAADCFAHKYALRAPDGVHRLELTPGDMHERLARELHRVEARYPNPLSPQRIRELLSSWDVVPQGGTMAALGDRHTWQSLSNCFVVPSPRDSYGGILRTDQEQVQVMKRRGGVGFDLSTIRPRGARTRNAAQTSDGVALFMRRFSNSCREVAQGGRRGALMLTLSVHHPDVLEFADAKRDLLAVTGANVSVRVSDEFMRAVVNGLPYEQRFPVDGPDAGSVVRRADGAAELWERLTGAMRDVSEPGLLFWDTVRRMGPADAYPEFESTSTNPCGEITLSPYDSCRLMVVNAARFVDDPFTERAAFDWSRFEGVARDAQRLMDDVVDLELEAVERIIEKVSGDPEPPEVKAVELDLWRRVKLAGARGRRTGLGITGLGDVFAMLGHRYGSPQSVEVAGDVYRRLARAAWQSSIEMASERGAFPAFDRAREEGHPFVERVLDEVGEKHRRLYREHGRRNIACTTTAPTGTVSLLTRTTSGMEPCIFLQQRRRRKVGAGERADYVDASGDRWQSYELVHPGARLFSEVTGCSPSESPYAGSQAHEVDPLEKVAVQAAAQRWVCHSISNTTNMPRGATREQVAALALEAWRSGCKGVTVYREGSRDAVIESAEPRHDADSIVETTAPRRPEVLPCRLHRVRAGDASGESEYLVVVGLLGGKPFEVFAGLAEDIGFPRRFKEGTVTKRRTRKSDVALYDLRVRTGDDPATSDEDVLLFRDMVRRFDNPTFGALTRSVSLSLRHGVPVRFVVEQLRKADDPAVHFAKVLARVLGKHYVEDGQRGAGRCRACGEAALVYQEGCATCTACGDSRCG